MSIDDPFFVVRDEVLTSLTKARSQYQRWIELQEDSNAGSKEEFKWITTELRNALRSIEWDLEDLDETIGIVESNPRKFKLDTAEISKRRQFVAQTKNEVQAMQEKLADFNTSSKEKRTSTMSAMINNPNLNFGNAVGNLTGTKYTRLQNETESPHRTIPVESAITMEDNQKQHLIIQHNNEVESMKNNVLDLRTGNRSTHHEVDEQAVMLDDVGQEVEVAGSRLDTTLKKVAKVFHLNNDRRQLTAVGVLSSLIVIVVFVVFTL